jgi:hypothetical protein
MQMERVLLGKQSARGGEKMLPAAPNPGEARRAKSPAASQPTRRRHRRLPLQIGNYGINQTIEVCIA